MSRRHTLHFALTVLVFAALVLAATTLAGESRGELLYANHCIACHTAQVHWRDRRLATDWQGLEAQVRRWQAAGMLQWSDEDVRDVTRYLNDTIYRFPPAGG